MYSDVLYCQAVFCLIDLLLVIIGIKEAAGLLNASCVAQAYTGKGLVILYIVLCIHHQPMKLFSPMCLCECTHIYICIDRNVCSMNKDINKTQLIK